MKPTTRVLWKNSKKRIILEWNHVYLLQTGSLCYYDDFVAFFAGNLRAAFVGFTRFYFKPLIFLQKKYGCKTQSTCFETNRITHWKTPMTPYRKGNVLGRTISEWHSNLPSSQIIKDKKNKIAECYNKNDSVMLITLHDIMREKMNASGNVLKSFNYYYLDWICVSR